MSNSLALMLGIAALAEAGGLTLLFRPAAVRRRFAIPDGEPAVYALRIVGMMLAALGLFLGGFAIVFTLSSE